MNKLDNIYDDFGDGPFDFMYFQFNLSFIKEELRGKDVLEMSTNIYSTAELARLAKRLDVVEGSSKKSEDLAKVIARNKILNTTCFNSFFEDFEPPIQYDEIILFRCLEHLPNAHYILKKTRKWLKPGGYITISVPNSGSLHRRLGVKLGMLPDITTLTDDDKRKGHVYNYIDISLVDAIEKAGYSLNWVKGSFLKIGTDGTMKNDPRFYTPEKMRALFELSKDIPNQYCAELIARAQNV